jgi:hypothetical protein
MNSRQEGKLTDRIRLLTGNRNGEAKGLSRLPVFLAIFDQHVPLISRHVILVMRCISLLALEGTFSTRQRQSWGLFDPCLTLYGPAKLI